MNMLIDNIYIIKVLNVQPHCDYFRIFNITSYFISNCLYLVIIRKMKKQDYHTVIKLIKLRYIHIEHNISKHYVIFNF